MTCVGLGSFLLGCQQIKKERSGFAAAANGTGDELVAGAVAAAPAAVRKEHEARCVRRQVQLALQRYLLERDENFFVCHCFQKSNFNSYRTRARAKHPFKYDDNPIFGIESGVFALFKCNRSRLTAFNWSEAHVIRHAGGTRRMHIFPGTRLVRLRWRTPAILFGDLLVRWKKIVRLDGATLCLWCLRPS